MKIAASRRGGNVLINALDQCSRCLRRRQQHPPFHHFEAGQPGFGKGRCFRIGRETLGTADADDLQASAADVLLKARRRGHHQADLPAQQGRSGLRAALERNMNQVDAQRALECFTGAMTIGIDARTAIGKLARIGACQGGEIGRTRGAKIGPRHQYRRGRADMRHGTQIAPYVVGKIVAQGRGDHEGAGQQSHDMRIRRRAHHALGGDDRRAAGFVLDQNLFAPETLQPLSQQPRHDVRGTTRCGGDDETYRPLRPACCVVGGLQAAHA